MHNAPYVHPRLDSIIELCQAFPIVPQGALAGWVGLWSVIVTYPGPTHLFFRLVCSVILLKH